LDALTLSLRELSYTGKRFNKRNIPAKEKRIHCTDGHVHTLSDVLTTVQPLGDRTTDRIDDASRAQHARKWEEVSLPFSSIMRHMKNPTLPLPDHASSCVPQQNQGCPNLKKQP
jgi:hypothetical protein